MTTCDCSFLYMTRFTNTASSDSRSRKKSTPKDSWRMPRRKRHLVRARIQSSLFAASRATGRIFVIDANSLEVKNEFQVGSRPDGLAHDPNRKNFLVADVADSNARLFHIQTGEITGTTRVRGRSRWTFFDKKTDRFLVNFRDPVEFALLHN